MADLQLRFHHDMLVLSTPIARQLERIGIDSARDNELTLLLEPEVMAEIYALEAAAGAQCVVADTAFMTPARLAHSNMRDSADKLAASAIQVATEHTPQHVLVEIGPCGLPLDASSKASLNENREQYARAASAFAGLDSLFDAFFLNGFTSCVDLKCALMGMRKVTDKPVLASVDLAVTGGFSATADARAGVDAASGDSVAAGASVPPEYTLGGRGRETLDQAVAVMAEYGAQVAGFQIAAAPAVAARFVGQVAEASVLPVLVQLDVADVDPEQVAPTPENPYFEPDSMIDAADELRAAGAQFLRATGNATPSYTGALVAATVGDSVERPQVTAARQGSAAAADPDELAALLRARVSQALDVER